jgi:hypothetical protein
VGLTTPHSKKLIVTKVEQRESWMDLTMMERAGDRWGKNGRILFDRPKPTVGCSANGRRIWRRIQIREFLNTKLSPFFSHVLSGPNILIFSHKQIECNWKC